MGLLDDLDPDDTRPPAPDGEAADGGDDDQDADRIPAKEAVAATAGATGGAAVGTAIGALPGGVIGAVTGAIRGVAVVKAGEIIDGKAEEKGREIAGALTGAPDDEAPGD